MPRRRVHRQEPRPTRREPTYQAHAPDMRVTDWLQNHSGGCEACGATEPRSHRDLFQAKRSCSRADREGLLYERLCAGCAAQLAIVRQWEAGVFVRTLQ